MGLDFDFSRLSNRNPTSGDPNTSPSFPQTPFAFRAGPPPAPLKFSCHANPTADSYVTLRDDARFKRKRTCEDHPGPIRKKRRLRLTLITSRLSRPFAVPTTHIVDRGRSRIAVWAKQKALGRNLLRKAAILNRVQYRVEAAIAVSPNMAAGRRDEIELLRRKGIEMTHLARLRGSLAMVNSTSPVGILDEAVGVESSTTRTAATAVTEVPRCSPNFRTGVDGRRDYAPSPPSPLGQSNYDALDLEEAGEAAMLSADRHQDAGGEGEDQNDNDGAYFDSLIFGVASPSPDDSVFVSQYDRLDYLHDNHYSSSIFSACSPSTATAISASEDDFSSNDTGSGTSMYDQLTEIFSDDAVAPAAASSSPPVPAAAVMPPKPQRPKGWNPNFASAPALPPKPQQSEEERRRASPPQSDDHLAEIMREKERQRQVLFLDLPNPC